MELSLKTLWFNSTAAHEYLRQCIMTKHLMLILIVMTPLYVIAVLAIYVWCAFTNEHLPWDRVSAFAAAEMLGGGIGLSAKIVWRYVLAGFAILLVVFLCLSQYGNEAIIAFIICVISALKLGAISNQLGSEHDDDRSSRLAGVYSIAGCSLVILGAIL